jgi:hypothetical protein
MVWLNNGIPAEICEREPALREHGFFRRLNNGKFEFISFCDERARHWLAVYDRDFNRVLDELLPRQ